MTELLFSVLFGQMGLILLLLFKTPLRKLVVMGLDRVKRGRGPLVVKSVAATVFVIMLYTVYSVQELSSRPIEKFNPTDQVLLGYQLLQASLMGFSLFLALMIDRLHHYIRELRMLRKSTDATKKQNRESEEAKSRAGEELKDLKDAISELKVRARNMESEYKAKQKESKAAETQSESLKKQSEGLLLEYDRLLEENQNLQNQLLSIDQNLSQPNGKKTS